MSKRMRKYRFGPGSTDKQLAKTTESCSLATTCENCTAISNWYGGCHWCDADQACHSYGSIYGCVYGSTCGKSNIISSIPTISPTFDDTICHQQKTCTDCSLLSSACHWCSHDFSCHAKGTINGCSIGVNCYEDKHCQRIHPQTLIPNDYNEKADTRWHEQSKYAMIVFCGLFVSAGLYILIATIYFGIEKICRHIQSNRDAAQLLDLSTSIDNNNTESLLDGSNDLQRPLIFNESNTVSMEQPLSILSSSNTCINEQIESNYCSEDSSLASNTENANLIPTETDNNFSQSTSIPSIRNNHDRISGSRRSRNRSIHRKTLIRRIYSPCIFCYSLSLFAVTIALVTVLYIPLAPVYNICNNDIDWNLIIDSIASSPSNLKTGEYELLGSISNPNYGSIVIENGQGSLIHNSAIVGNFSIPSSTVLTSSSVTDVLFVVKFNTGMWHTMGLIDDYYQGKLKLKVNTTVTIRFLSLFNYTYTVPLHKHLLNINDKGDRGGCLCSSWNSSNADKAFHINQYNQLAPTKIGI